MWQPQLMDTTSDLIGSNRGTVFRDLHREGTFVLPNAWDAASAAVIVSAGARAVATTSSGISWANGHPDGEHMSRNEVVESIAKIVHAVDVPVSADIEGGYGSSADDVAVTIDAVIAAGAVGVNLEDRNWPGGSGLREVADQCERIAAARKTADRMDSVFTMNARTDVFLAGVGDPEEREELTAERGKQYAQAGADCLFVPGIADIETIARVAETSPLPVNILLDPGRGPNISELTKVGVRRISVGGSLATTALAAVLLATKALLNGDDEPLRGKLTHATMQELMAHNS